MKKLVVCGLCFMAFSVLFSQIDTNKKAVFHLSFVTPLGTNGHQSYEYTNKVSINLLVGGSKNEEVFTLGGLSNIIRNNAQGLQIAGLSNYVGNEGKGIQIGGLANINKDAFCGTQIGGLINTASNMKGAQIGGLINLAEKVDGVQIGGLINRASKMEGTQIGGLINMSSDVEGVQIGGLINRAKDVEGFQLAGLINVAKKVEGVQLAVLINIAEDSDTPIGIINIIKNGEMGIAVTYDAIGSAVLSFRSGGKYTYGIIGIGYNHKKPGDRYMLECGLGVHIPVASWFRINQELKSSNIGLTFDSQVNNSSYSLIPAFKIGNHCELFAGVSINYMNSQDLNNSKMFSDHSIWEEVESNGLQQVYIGYQFGCQYIF